MNKDKITKVPPKSVKKRLQAPRANGKRVAMRPEQEVKLVEAATKLAIKLHRDALKELERY